jgi:hypothetical protein
MTSFDLKSVVRANILELVPYRCARDVRNHDDHLIRLVYGPLILIGLTMLVGLQRRNPS